MSRVVKGLRPTLRSELRKITTTRLWWILLIGLAAYMAFLGAVLAFSLTAATGDSALTPREVTGAVYTLGTSLGYGFPLIVGALVVTSEFRHQTVTPTFLHQPVRDTVLVAKLLAAGAVGLLYGVAGTAGAIVAGAPVIALQDVPTRLGEPDTWVSAAFSVVALTLWALIGVGLGTLLRDQVAAIVTVLAFTQFVEPLLRIGLSAVDGLDVVARFLPGAAAEAVAGSSIYSSGNGLDLLPRWAGIVVMLAYVVVFAVVGRRTTLHRDIT